MSQEKIKIGKEGERFVADFFRQKGYKILEKNFRCRMGEIDLIVQKDERLLFVEVKTRRGNQFGSPLEAIVPSKKRRMERLAEYYLLRKKKELLDPCLAVAALDLSKETPYCELIELYDT